MEEYKAIKELREDQSRVVLTADKGVAIITMDKKDYIYKALSLLADTNTYKTISRDPTNKLKIKPTDRLKDIKQAGGLKDSTYHKMYPTSAAPKVLWPFQNPYGWHPTQTHSVQQGFHHKWGG